MCNCAKQATPLNELPPERAATTGPLSNEPVAVTFIETMRFPVDVMLPLRLIAFNRNGRKLLLTGNETTLPKSLAEWLAQNSSLRGKVSISAENKEDSDIGNGA